MIRSTFRSTLRVVIVCMIVSVAGFASILFIQDPTKQWPFVETTQEWAIGIYTGDSSLHLTSPINGSMSPASVPVLTAKHVTDVPAAFVADPFMVYENNTWYMFFEVLNTSTRQGDIGLATSQDGLKWKYQQIVLDEPFHLSFPYVFKFEDAYYMVPESRRAQSIRLYKAVDFPLHWSLVKILLRGFYADSAIFRFDNKWWLLTDSNPGIDDILSLYYADTLTGPWSEHPESPVVQGNAHIARPVGRVITADGRLIRFAQDDRPYYGKQVRAFEITELTTTSYKEVEVPLNPPITASGFGWNSKGMHTVDAHSIGDGRWIAAVDGQRDVRRLALRYLHRRF